jgi:hypothetical protein
MAKYLSIFAHNTFFLITCFVNSSAEVTFRIAISAYSYVLIYGLCLSSFYILRNVADLFSKQYSLMDNYSLNALLYTTSQIGDEGVLCKEYV